MSRELVAENPRSWEMTTIGEVAIVNPPGSSASVPDDQIVTFLPMAAVEELSGKIDLSCRRSFGEVKKGFTRFRDGDVLFAKITPSMENGKVAVAADLLGGVGCGTTEFHVIRPYFGVAPDYLRYYMVRSAFRRTAKRNMQGAVGQQRVPADFVRNAALPLAPSAEQTRIVSKIDELFSRIDDGERALARVRKLLERYRQSVLKAAVTGELTRDWREQHQRDPDHPIESGAALLKRILAARRAAWEQSELAKMQAKGKPPKTDAWKHKYKPPTSPDTINLSTLPQGWVWASLDQLASAEPGAITDGPFGSKLKTAHYTSEGPRVVRLQNIKDGWFADERAHISQEHFAALQKHRVQEGDLLIAALGESPPRACVAPGWLGPAIVKADCIRIRLHDAASAACVSAFLNSPLSRTIAKAIIHGVGRPRLNLGEIKSLMVPLCPEREQQAICDRLDLASSATERLRKEVDSAFTRSVQSKQAILGSAFSGRLVSQDPSDEPASALLERIATEHAQVVHTKPRHIRKPSARPRA